MSTNLVDRIARDAGWAVYRTGTGFKWMGALVEEKERAGEEKFVVAFEESIGAMVTTLGRDKDGLTAAARALEIYTAYRGQGMDFLDILEKEIYPH